jgi:hypothetical protein
MMAMDQFKIENYQRDKPGMAFPSWEPVPPEKCSLFRERIASQVELQPRVDSLVLLRKLSEISFDVTSFEPDSARPDLLKILQSLKIEPLKQVYINWYRYENIDKMTFLDLELHLDDIWYPASDDIDIFDDTLKWILSVTHYGIVRAVILKNSGVKSSLPSF